MRSQGRHMVRRVLCLVIVRDGFAEGLGLGRGVPCSRLRLNFRRAVYIVRPRAGQGCAQNGSGWTQSGFIYRSKSPALFYRSNTSKLIYRSNTI